MPIYEYRCTSCGETIEILQRMGEPPLEACKACEGRLEKLVSRTSFQLKGGGWAASGYGPQGGTSKVESSGDGAKEADGAKGSVGAADGKPETPSKKGSCGSGCGCH